MPVSLWPLVAIPIAWILCREWLSGFAYHINPGADVFLVAFAAVILVSTLVVVGEIVKASKVNPVDILKSE